jgi:hypothetical protein
MMSRELYIQPELKDVIVDALDFSESPLATCHCASCGYPMRFPLIARERDIDVMQKLIEIGEKYLKDRNVLAEMVAEIRAECHITIAKRTKKP